MTRDTAKVIIESNLRHLDDVSMRYVAKFILAYTGDIRKKKGSLNDKARSGGTH